MGSSGWGSGKYTNIVYNAGLNFKPSSFVALKLEDSRLEVNWMGDMKAKVWTAAAQSAVAF